MLGGEPAAQQQATLLPEWQTQHEPRNQIIPPPVAAAIPATGTAPTDDIPVSEAAPAIAQRSAGVPLTAADVFPASAVSTNTNRVKVSEGAAPTVPPSSDATLATSIVPEGATLAPQPC